MTLFILIHNNLRPSLAHPINASNKQKLHFHFQIQPFNKHNSVNSQENKQRFKRTTIISELRDN